MHTQETKDKIRSGYYTWLDNLKSDPKKYLEYKTKIASSRQKTETKRIEKVKDTWKQKLLSADFDSLTLWKKRDRCIEEQGGACGKCKLTEWLGHRLALELDHVDGNHDNYTRENYIAICPNCHSITPTWRGRNKRSCKRVTDNEAIEALKNSSSIRQALIKVGLTPKGGNYKRFTKLKEQL